MLFSHNLSEATCRLIRRAVENSGFKLVVYAADRWRIENRNGGNFIEIFPNSDGDYIVQPLLAAIERGRV